MTSKVLPAIDGPWGEVHDHIIKDAVTQAEWELEQFGAKTALRNTQALQELIDKKTWRSAEAIDVLLKITRLALEEGIIVFDTERSAQ